MQAHDDRLHDSSRTAVRRVLAHLRDIIEDSDLRQRDVEDRLGWSRGYLSQVLNGYVELRVRHLDLLLEALGVPAARFFREVAPRPIRRHRRGDPRRRGPVLKVSHDAVRIYGFGIEAIRRLHRRLERCEKAIEAMARSAVLARKVNGPG